MILRLFTNVAGCLLDPPKAVHFGGSDTGAATVLESQSNKGFNNLLCCFSCKFALICEKAGAIDLVVHPMALFCISYNAICVIDNSCFLPSEKLCPIQVEL